MGLDTCVICFDEIQRKDLYSLEQCGHSFHTDCIVKNIQSGNISCPTCRSFPTHISNKCEFSDLRNDLIDEQNNYSEAIHFEQAFDMVDQNMSSKRLGTLCTRYRTLQAKNKDIINYNNHVFSEERKRDKEISIIDKQYEKDISNLYKKKWLEQKEIKKRYKIPRVKKRKDFELNRLFASIASYVGFVPIEY